MLRMIAGNCSQHMEIGKEKEYSVQNKDDRRGICLGNECCQVEVKLIVWVSGHGSTAEPCNLCSTLGEDEQGK
eukprot:scaffold38981_cov39-Prasinocladus_malaysianus.AAC.1